MYKYTYIIRKCDLYELFIILILYMYKVIKHMFIVLKLFLKNQKAKKNYIFFIRNKFK